MEEPGVPDPVLPAPPPEAILAAAPAAVVAEPHPPGPAPFRLTRPTGVRYLVVAAACSLSLLGYVHRQAFAGGASEIMRDFGMGDQQMGYYWAAFLIAYGLFQVPCGMLSDVLGTRHLLAVLVLGWSLTMAALAVVRPAPGAAGQTLLLLLALRFLFGTFQAGTFPALSRVLADWVPVRSRGSAQGAVWTFSRLGGAGTPILLIPLFAYFAGWRAPFLLLAALGVLWSIVFWAWFRDRPADMPQVNDAELALIAAGRVPAGRPGPVPWGRMLRSRSVWGLLLMYGSGGFAGHFFTSMLPVYLEKHRRLDPATAKVVTGLPLACGIVACFLGGYLSDRLIVATGSRKWGRRLVPCFATVLAAVSLLATRWAEPVWLFGGLICFTFFLNDLCMGPAWAASADIGERYAGTLSGGMNSIGALCGAASAALAGGLLEATRYDLLFGIYAGCYILSLVGWLLIDVTQGLAGPGEPAA
jgi:sugar phosphate permease